MAALDRLNDELTDRGEPWFCNCILTFKSLLADPLDETELAFFKADLIVDGVAASDTEMFSFCEFHLKRSVDGVVAKVLDSARISSSSPDPNKRRRRVDSILDSTLPVICDRGTGVINLEDISGVARSLLITSAV
jgi:hypothetical protein